MTLTNRLRCKVNFFVLFVFSFILRHNLKCIITRNNVLSYYYKRETKLTEKMIGTSVFVVSAMKLKWSCVILVNMSTATCKFNSNVCRTNNAMVFLVFRLHSSTITVNMILLEFEPNKRLSRILSFNEKCTQWMNQFSAFQYAYLSTNGGDIEVVFRNVSFVGQIATVSRFHMKKIAIFFFFFKADEL